ncbi:hypothetical protein BSKO_10768 [Bryopsis sp. KO-2023]|nr:hypothetical protein BSKO_10768 [Bryopsis sp. KO-2023]
MAERSWQGEFVGPRLSLDNFSLQRRPNGVDCYRDALRKYLDRFTPVFGEIGKRNEGFQNETGSRVMADRRIGRPGRKRKRAGPGELELGVEEFLSRNDSLRSDVWRLYDLLKDLDKEGAERTKELEKDFSAVEDKAKKLKRKKPSKALQKQARNADKKINKAVAEIRNINETKIVIAQQGYDLLDRVVRELDHRISMCEASMPPRDPACPDLSTRQGMLQSEGFSKTKQTRPRNGMLNGVLSNGVQDPSKHKRRRMPPRLCPPYAGGPMMFGCPTMPPIPFPPLSFFRFPGPSSSQPFPKAFIVEDSEPVYCWCQQVAFGDMISCDNPKCPYEWFHYDCVGMTKADLPKTKWYCPICRGKEEPATNGG